MATRTVYICDRCKKEYDPSKPSTAKNRSLLAECFDFTINIAAREHSGKRPRDKGTQGCYDLCPECAGKFVEWLQHFSNQLEN